jgi:hypothetical protein
MTELKDIRAGNKMLFNRSGSTVTVLKVRDNEVLLDTYPKSSHYANSNVSGIMLTTSMLEKLSFKNDDEPAKWYGQGINIYIRRDGFFYGLRILRNRAKIQYLHQLQNYIADFYANFRDQERSLYIPDSLT